MYEPTNVVRVSFFYLALPVGSVPELDGPVVGARGEPSVALDDRVHGIVVVVQRPDQAPRVGVPHLTWRRQQHTSQSNVKVAQTHGKQVH